MPKITEIIPNDMPDWAIEAMDNGQLFNVTFDKIKEKDQLLLESVALIRQHVAKEAAVKELIRQWELYAGTTLPLTVLHCSGELQAIFTEDKDNG